MLPGAPQGFVAASALMRRSTGICQARVSVSPRRSLPRSDQCAVLTLTRWFAARYAACADHAPTPCVLMILSSYRSHASGHRRLGEGFPERFCRELQLSIVFRPAQRFSDSRTFVTTHARLTSCLARVHCPRVRAASPRSEGSVRMRARSIRCPADSLPGLGAPMVNTRTTQQAWPLRRRVARASEATQFAAAPRNCADRSTCGPHRVLHETHHGRLVQRCG